MIRPEDIPSTKFWKECYIELVKYGYLIENAAARATKATHHYFYEVLTPPTYEEFIHWMRFADLFFNYHEKLEEYCKGEVSLEDKITIVFLQEYCLKVQDIMPVFYDFLRKYWDV